MKSTRRHTQQLVAAIAGSGLVLAGLAATPAAATGPSMTLDRSFAVAGQPTTVVVSGSPCRGWNGTKFVIGRMSVQVVGSRAGAWATGAPQGPNGEWTLGLTLQGNAPTGNYTVSASCSVLMGPAGDNRPVNNLYIDYGTRNFALVPVNVPQRRGSEY